MTDIGIFVKGWIEKSYQVLTRASGSQLNPFSTRIRHPRAGGGPANLLINSGVPAFAGMTKLGRVIPIDSPLL